jgi:ankyrin repeat protein
VSKRERYSPLTVLCSRPDVTEEEVKKALYLGANRFHKDEDGCTALHWAAMKGVVAAAAVLTAASGKGPGSSLADVEKLLKTKDGDGKTPLALAKESVEPDHEEVEALLMAVRACRPASQPACLPACLPLGLWSPLR